MSKHPGLKLYLANWTGDSEIRSAISRTIEAIAFFPVAGYSCTPPIYAKATAQVACGWSMNVTRSPTLSSKLEVRRLPVRSVC